VLLGVRDVAVGAGSTVITEFSDVAVLDVVALSVTVAIMFAVHADVIAVFGENTIVLVPSTLSVLDVALNEPHKAFDKV
jgi:hypothetical protein